MRYRHRTIACPFCDEKGYVDNSPQRKIYNLGYKVYYPRKCIMGHEFYSVEFVPDNYEQLLHDLKVDLKAQRKAQNKKNAKKISESARNKRRNKEAIFREAAKDGLIKIPHGLGQKLVKLAGRKDYYAETLDDRFKSYRKRVVAELKARRDE